MTFNPDSLLPCVIAFILAIVCTNPILRGAFITFLEGLVATLEAEIALLIATLGRLNVVHALLNVEIQAVTALVNQTQSQLNLIMGPMQTFASCESLGNINKYLQNNCVGQSFVWLQRKIYELNRITNLANYQSIAMMKIQKIADDANNMIQAINVLCPA